MPPMIKAPDTGVVKSLAKALRKSLPETVKLSHSKALEISSNAFGFSSWHACRTHFDRLNAGAFDPTLNRGEKRERRFHLLRQEVDRVLDLLSGELRTFRSGPTDETGGISCGRSLDRFLVPLIELGARHDEEILKRGGGRLINETCALRLSPHVNTLEPVPGDLHFVRDDDTLLIGSTAATKIYTLHNWNIPRALRRGLLNARRDKPGGVVDLDLIRERLRTASAYPHPEATFAVSSGFLTEIRRGCQARINDATAPEPEPEPDRTG